MTDREQLESLLAGVNGGTVTLPRKQAQELAHKLRARGGREGLARLEQLLAAPGDVELDADDAAMLLEELRTSGQRWVFGTQQPRELPSLKAPQREPEPEKRRGFLARLFRPR